jgi:hypothetical protein
MTDSQLPLLGEAEYQLEIPLTCPHCREAVSSVFVIRMLRVRVNFVSSLPRRGYCLVCPQCRAILTAELGGMV